MDRYFILDDVGRDNPIGIDFVACDAALQQRSLRALLAEGDRIKREIDKR